MPEIDISLVVKRCSCLIKHIFLRVCYPSVACACVMKHAHTHAMSLLSAHLLLSACFLIVSCYKCMCLNVYGIHNVHYIHSKTGGRRWLETRLPGLRTEYYAGGGRTFLYSTVKWMSAKHAHQSGGMCVRMHVSRGQGSNSPPSESWCRSCSWSC